MTQPPYKPDKPTKKTTKVPAKRKLELSLINPQTVQKELMGVDVDVKKFALYLSSQVKVDLVDRIVDGSVSRSMDTSTELSVTINDYDRALLQSGLLSSKLDVQIDGLWFRLHNVEKQGDNLILKFEDREIAVLRTYSKFKKAARKNVTRAEFVLSMIREVKEFTIPVVIPELHRKQPLARYNGDPVGVDTIINKSKGMPKNPNKKKNPLLPNFPLPGPLTITDPDGKNLRKIDDDQWLNASIVMATGMDTIPDDAPHKRKMIVCAIMTVIVETGIHNTPAEKSDGDSAGIFQQTPGFPPGHLSIDDRMDVETSSRIFFKQIMKRDKVNPHMGYGDLCQDVQGSGHPDRYGLHRKEAERIVSAYGIPGGDSEENSQDWNTQQSTISTGQGIFYFWRGTLYDRQGKKYIKAENSWTCIKRLADDVNWAAFFVSGTFYFMSYDDLLKQAPLDVLDEFDEGILSVDGDYDNNKKSATLTVVARVGKWMVPPSSLVVVENMGPWNGRWIVSEYERSLFDLNATITLTKAVPALPEPQPGGQQLPPQLVQSGTGSGGGGGNDGGNSWGGSILLPKTGQALIQAVLKNSNINLGTAHDVRGDIKSGVIYEGLLNFLLVAAGDGWTLDIGTLKDGHSIYTSEGGISAHGQGRAVDITNYNNFTDVNYKLTQKFMKYCATIQKATGFSQLIGPDPSLVIPLGNYDSKVLGEHKNHCHVGWHLV